ncbi:MAG: histidine kinase dimerization/phospho-acceptor domain-containing protein [Planctomycetota bacterium]
MRLPKMLPPQAPARPLRLTELAAALAHAVRNPLAGARANVERTSRKLAAAGAEHAICNETIQCLDRIGSAIDQFMELAEAPSPVTREISSHQWMQQYGTAARIYGEKLGIEVAIDSGTNITFQTDSRFIQKAVERILEFSTFMGARALTLTIAPSGGKVNFTFVMSETESEGAPINNITFNASALGFELAVARNSAASAGAVLFIPTNATAANTTDSRCIVLAFNASVRESAK